MELTKLTNDEFQRITKIIYDHSGIHLPEQKLSLLSNRLRKRLRSLKLDSFADYEKLISSPKGLEEEMPHFLSAVTTNETYFFRNEQLWKLFHDELVPYVVALKEGKRKVLNIRSAASSSGEEAYTAAIALRETLSDFASWTVKLVGTDISANILAKAKAGRYGEYAVHKMQPAQIRRWFKKDGEEYVLCDEIRRMVRFEFHNLRDPFPATQFDLTFLRNVLMYFDNPMKIQVLEAVSAGITPGGLLIVGDVDPIRTTAELSAAMPCEFQRSGVYRKPGGPAIDLKRVQAAGA